MGPVSLVLRAPAVALVRLWDTDGQTDYQVGALVCLIGAVLIGLWLVRTLSENDLAPATLAGLAGVLLVAVVGARALYFGHPEEPLAALLVVAALVLALRRQFVAAGIVLGLAIATKEWALLALPGVVLLAPREAFRPIVAAVAVVATLLVGTMAVGSPESFRSAHDEQRAGHTHTMTPASVWYRLGETRLVEAPGGARLSALYPPEPVGRWCRIAVILVALLAAIAFVRRRGFDSLDALALVGFVFGVRVLLDTQTFSYHLIPLLVVVPVWEVCARRRFPWIAVSAMVAFLLTVHLAAPHLDANGFNAFYLSWTIPLTLYLGWQSRTRSP